MDKIKKVLMIQALTSLWGAQLPGRAVKPKKICARKECGMEYDHRGAYCSKECFIQDNIGRKS